MEECKRQNLDIHGPDVNESAVKFSVNKKGAIRFGLAAIKGVGESAALEILREQKENGDYASIFDLCKRVNQRAVNKKSLENLAIAGAFDAFGHNRSVYVTEVNGSTLLDLAVKHGARMQAEAKSAQASLFGGGADAQIEEPKMPLVEPWNLLEKLHKEKELIGIYISGHPLSKFKFEIDHLSTHSLMQLEEHGLGLLDKEIGVAGLITKTRDAISKTGKPFMIFTIEDFSGNREFALFGEKYASFRGYIEPNAQIFISGKGERSYRDESKLEINIRDIYFLADAIDKELKSVTINLPVERINDQLMLELFELSDERGKVQLNFKIMAQDQSIKALSRKYRIKMDEITKQKLEELDLNYRFN